MARGAEEPGIWTVRRVLEWTTRYLRRGGVEAARFEAEWLLAHALRTERLQLYLNPDRPLSEAERARFRRLVQQRYRGVPLAYLLGTVEFFNVTLRVNEAVLIPRPETEQLVERILRDHQGRPPGRFVDLGTGSGAIALALLKAWRDARAAAVAVDISPAALRVARENAEKNGLLDRVTFVCGDWLSAFRPDARFELIVSNPPYVPTEALPTLPREVRVYEPRRALDGGPRGLAALARLAREAPPHLAPGGRLYLEIGAQQAQDVVARLERTGAFARIDVLKDLAGHDRIVRAERFRDGS